WTIDPQKWARRSVLVPVPGRAHRSVLRCDPDYLWRTFGIFPLPPLYRQTGRRLPANPARRPKPRDGVCHCAGARFPMVRRQKTTNGHLSYIRFAISSDLPTDRKKKVHRKVLFLSVHWSGYIPTRDDDTFPLLEGSVQNSQTGPRRCSKSHVHPVERYWRYRRTFFRWSR